MLILFIIENYKIFKKNLIILKIIIFLNKFFLIKIKNQNIFLPIILLLINFNEYYYKFNQINHNILTREFPNMKKIFQENVTVMKRIKKDKNYNNEALVENVKRKYKSSIYSSSFILLKYFRNT